jgi:hypothetical protein
MYESGFKWDLRIRRYANYAMKEREDIMDQ